MTFDFEDLAIRIENRRLWATGSVYIEYTYHEAQRDVGYRAGVEIDDLCDWDIHLTDEDGEDVFLPAEQVIPHLVIAVHKCDIVEFVEERL